MKVPSWLVEQRIADAQRRGELDNLPGKGKPQELDPLSGLDEETRRDALLAKATGAMSLEVELGKEIQALRDFIARTDTTDEQRREAREKIAALALRLSVVHEANGRFLLANATRTVLP
jgi:hypothetical protein